MSNPSLTPFFAPLGIAVLGASQDPNKLGYILARNLVHSNFLGAIHFVNPRGGKLLGLPVYTHISQTPDPVDLALLLIPAPVVPQALVECGERGIRAVILCSGGFRETGPEGAALEQECFEIARRFEMRLMGPNCIGLLDTHLPLNATFLPPPGPTPGDVAFISHSGAICAAVIDWARGQGFGLSRLVSLGNQVDVSETDMLAPVAADRYTNVLALYLEGVQNGRRFVEEAANVARKKPIIALKVGRFASGQRAVASHTGALAGHEEAFEAAFHRAGVLRAESSEEMFDWARALAWCPLPAGRGVAVLTNAGGPGVTAADALEANGLYLADLTEETHHRLHAILPAAASLQNPVDMLAAASPEQYVESLRILLEDDSVHSALVILPPPPAYTAGAVAKSLIPVIHASEKPVVISLMGERMIQEAVEHCRAARVPEYRFPERAASALAVLVRRWEYLQRLSQPAVERESDGSPEMVLDPQQEEKKQLHQDLAAHYEICGDSFLPAYLVNRLVEAYGIPVPPSGVAATAEEVCQVADQVGYPVAMKIVSPDIVHKSDVGGVALGLVNEASAVEAFQAMIDTAHSAFPDARIDGVLIQRMIPSGQEVIIGSVKDPQFGPLMMFGSGGIEVEGLKDVEFALSPLDRLETERMLDSTWAGRRLKGYRTIQPADREAVIKTLMRLSELAADFPELSEIEINPLRVLPEGTGAFAVDVRIRLSGAVQAL